MIVRLVKMTFREENIPVFLRLFESVQPSIARAPGCIRLRLYRDITDKSVVFTYSEWRSVTDLDNYRNSILFRDTWNKTKPLFLRPAEAWSVEEP
jgi:heme-degrading monooxygenase HmoA